MAYETFGNFGRTAEEVIHAAKKQRQADTAVSTLLSPVSAAATKVARIATGKPAVDEETYVKAIVYKILKKKGLHPKAAFEKTIHEMFEKFMRQNKTHPFWTNPTLKK